MFSVTAESPGYLFLLLLVPLLWWLGRRSLAGLGGVRRFFALLLRTVVTVLLILALAQVQLVRTSDRLTVLYLLDQSQSIPEAQRRQMAQWVNASIAQHRQDRLDKAGVIVFARDAAIEYPPVDGPIQIRETIESLVDPSYTSLAAALKLAQATLPGDSAGRVVLVTDGNENLGRGLEQARALADSGIGIDVVPLRYRVASEVAVEKVKAPSDISRSQPFDLHVVLNNATEPGAVGAPVKGKLRITRRAGDQEQLVAEQPLELAPGKRVYTLREQLDASNFYTYEARFVADDPALDKLAQNNTATAFTRIRGQGQVLLIEDSEHKGEFDLLAERLRRERLEVTVIDTGALFSSLAELQPFDTVLLANVPREAFSDDQVTMLVNNTRQLGAGLVMLGGPNSFGAGGWANSELEAAMPVDFQIKNSKVVAQGALALVIDRSGSMSGEKLAMAKKAANAAVDVLSPHDYIAVTAFDSAGYVVVPSTQNQNPRSVKARVDRISEGGGTDMTEAVQMAHKELKRAEAKGAALRHMVILTDGHMAGSDYDRMIGGMRRSDQITVSTIAVGDDADKILLERLARIGGGKFYHASSPRILPQIFQREARVVSRPLIFEHPPGFRPQVKYPHEMVKGVEDSLPPITGYVQTDVKSGPLVEVALTAPLPKAATAENRTLLAGWTYGLGRTVAFTSDAGRRWASEWGAWPGYDKLFSQMVRWSMRPAGDEGKFQVATDVKDGRAQVVVTALDKDDNFLNFLTFSGVAIGPDQKPQPVKLEQTAPGRYVADFPANESGSYFLSLNPGPGSAPILTGINVPYSAEFLDREENEGLLESLAAITPRGGQSGRLLDAIAHTPDSPAAEQNVFRHNLLKPTSHRDAWPLLTFLVPLVFFADVFVRRVHVNFAWVPHYYALARDRLFRRQTPATVEAVMDRLRSRKAEVAESLEARRAATRFEPQDLTAAAPIESLDQAAVESPRPVKADAAPSMTSEPEQDSYTSRLLRAKKKVWDDRAADE